MVAASHRDSPGPFWIVDRADKGERSRSVYLHHILSICSLKSKKNSVAAGFSLRFFTKYAT